MGVVQLYNSVPPLVSASATPLLIATARACGCWLWSPKKSTGAGKPAGCGVRRLVMWELLVVVEVVEGGKALRPKYAADPSDEKDTTKSEVLAAAAADDDDDDGDDDVA